MSTLFDYAVRFKESQSSVAVSLNFLHKVGVFSPPKAPLPVTSVSLSQVDLTLQGHVPVQVVATVTYSDGTTNNSVTWSSSDETIATVDECGLVTPIADGEATITAKSKADQSKTADLPVTVAFVYIEPALLSAPKNQKKSIKKIEEPAPSKAKAEPKTENREIESSEYVMVEATKDTYASFTSNSDVSGFFDGGLTSIYLIFKKEDADTSGFTYKDLDLKKFETILFTSDFSTAEAQNMEFDDFNGCYIAVSSIVDDCEAYQSIDDKHFCFFDVNSGSYGACTATGYHLTRNYWRSNAYYEPLNPAKIGSVASADNGRILLEKGISFFIVDEDQGTFLAFFGNTRVGIANHYIEREVKLKSQESLTNWTKSYEPLDTAIDIALAQKYANEPISIYESEPYRYLDPDYDNRMVITSSNEMFKALADFVIKIPNPIWVYDVESEVVTQ